MSKCIQYIVTILALVSLILGTVGCFSSLPQSPSTSPPRQQDSPIEPSNPSWTFPSGTGSPTSSLPDFPPIIAEIMPSVVAVTTEMVVTSFFDQYIQSGAGSGVIIDAVEGYIVTNNHVVDGARSIQVELHDGRTFSATVVGTDFLTDLAVLKIDAVNLPYAPWGDSSQLVLGDWVLAIGNALGEGISASEGIVSRIDIAIIVEGNTLRGLVQTTAPINPGNSGGPLVNMLGQVIGITSAKIATVGVEGMGYAISSNTVKPIVEGLIRHGHITRSWLGVSLYTVDPFVATANGLSVDRGALVVEVVHGSPADIAGLNREDVIIQFKDKEITNTDDLIQAIQSCEIGEKVEITFVRGEDTKTTIATLEERSLL